MDRFSDYPHYFHKISMKEQDRTKAKEKMAKNCLWILQKWTKKGQKFTYIKIRQQSKVVSDHF